MSPAVMTQHHAPPSSFLAGKSAEQLAALLSRLSPEVQAQVRHHLSAPHLEASASPPRAPASPGPPAPPNHDQHTLGSGSPMPIPRSEPPHPFPCAAHPSSASSSAQPALHGAPATGLVEELEPPPPPQPAPPHVRRPSRPSSAATTTGGGGAMPLHALRETPLLSSSEMRALLPAVAPEAKRYLRELAAGSRGVAANQRALRELASFTLRSERARSEAEAERARLARLAAQQSQALVVSAHRMHAMREKVEQQRQQLEREAARSKQLERGLRAATRQPPPPYGRTGGGASHRSGVGAAAAGVGAGGGGVRLQPGGQHELSAEEIDEVAPPVRGEEAPIREDDGGDGDHAHAT